MKYVLANNYLEANVRWVGGAPNTHLHWTCWHSSLSGRSSSVNKYLSGRGIREICVDICGAISLSRGSSLPRTKSYPCLPKNKVMFKSFCFHNSLFCTISTAIHISSKFESLLFRLLFPARRSHSSWRVRMEAGGLATVGDYWYVIGIWCALIMLLDNPSL